MKKARMKKVPNVQRDHVGEERHEQADDDRVEGDAPAGERQPGEGVAAHGGQGDHEQRARHGEQEAVEDVVAEPADRPS
jgi:hypothetical protein